MRIHAIFNGFNEKEFAKKCLEHVEPYVDSIAISETSQKDGITLSNDGTHEDIMDFIEENKNKLVAIHYREPTKINVSTSSEAFDRNEGQIKTELMNMCNPDPGDWIYVLEADEFASLKMLKDFKSRYVLGHQILKKQDIRWIVVPQMEFIYRSGYFKYSWSGRLFKYGKGAHFQRCNKFFVGNTQIYDDSYRWDLPRQ